MGKFNHHDLEDAYQNAELKLQQIKLKYPENTIKSVRAFKNTVAHNYLVDVTRSYYRKFRKKLNPNLISGTDNPLKLAIANEEESLFNNVISLLNLREQTIIRYLLAGVRVKDISTLLNLTPDHISVIIQRAKAKIQKLINIGNENNA
jgi:RNA polymerase sigma factor (sigma-70 family)